MSVLPPEIESEIRNQLTKVLVEPENSECDESYYLNKQEIELHFSITYQKYYRKGQAEHGTEIIFRLDNRQDIVESDVKAIEKHLGNILKSKIPYEGDFSLEDEHDEHVFIDEIIQDA